METTDKIKEIKYPVMRALIVPNSGGEDYDFECVASPFTNGQLNYDWKNDRFFNQVLVPAAENTRTDRMESGLPLFDNHPWDKSAKNQLGISKGYEFTSEGIRLKIKWGAKADQATRDDVKNGITKTVSIEGDIYKYEITEKPGEIPVYRTADWEPTSVSLAPVPQDIASQIEVKRALEKQLKGEPQPQPDSFIHSLIKKF